MISKFFIDRPIFAIVISLLISIFGLLAIATLPVAKYPQVTPPQVRVSATYIGANAEVVGTTVASVIERQLVGVDNLVNMESSTNDNGSYSMTVQFKSGSDGDMDTVNTPEPRQPGPVDAAVGSHSDRRHCPEIDEFHGHGLRPRVAQWFLRCDVHEELCHAVLHG